jgi:hypothetical protein
MAPPPASINWLATSRRRGEEPVNLLGGGQRPSQVEEALTKALPAAVPVIGIANPVNTLTDPRLLDRDLPVMPKLEGQRRDRWAR